MSTPSPSPSPEEGLISGHNLALPFLGKVALRFRVKGRVYCHTFFVIGNFQLEALLG